MDHSEEARCKVCAHARGRKKDQDSGRLSDKHPAFRCPKLGLPRALAPKQNSPVDFLEDGRVTNRGETASLRFDVQTLEYSNMRKRKKIGVGLWDISKI